MRLVLIGGAIGLTFALMTVRLLSALLFQVAPLDAPTLTIVPLVLALVAFIACFVPAWRASRLDPFIALRED